MIKATVLSLSSALLSLLLLSSPMDIVSDAGRDAVPCCDEMGPSDVSLIVLGTLQDGGSPHIGCTRECCKKLYAHPDPTRKVVSLGLVDTRYNKWYLFDATPDMPTQIYQLRQHVPFENTGMPDGIFLTHAHIGHYTGLMFLGKEASNASQVPVYAMPRMKSFLEDNGPWSQLVDLQNIVLKDLSADQKVDLTPNLKVTPLMVPHRDEFSETVGFVITGPKKKVLFIPDIDKWGKWDRSILEMLSEVDYALIDGSFYDAEEIPYRDMSEIPHPFISESMQLFKNLSFKEKQKVYFIHLNHTNPVLNPDSPQYLEVEKQGFHIAAYEQELQL